MISFIKVYVKISYIEVSKNYRFYVKFELDCNYNSFITSNLVYNKKCYEAYFLWYFENFSVPKAHILNDVNRVYLVDWVIYPCVLPISRIFYINRFRLSVY